MPGNHLIVTDTAANIARLESLVAELDKPGSGSGVEVVSLKFASAEEVASQLRATFGATDSAVNKINRHFQQVAGGTGDLPTDFTVVAAPQANSLILVGLPMQIAETKRIISLMDVENPHGFGRLNAIFLKYLSAEEASKSLNALLGKAPATEGAPVERDIAIEPSIANNALLVDASPQDFEYVRRLVERLDVIPQQVLVEVLIAEVDMEKGLDLGVEWFGIDQPEDGETGGFGRTRYGESDSMMDLLTEGTFPQGLAMGVISGTFTGPDGKEYNQIPLYLKAVAGDRDLKILSNIPLWAQNNLEASVSVVENIPILKSSVEGSGSDRDFIQNIDRLDVGIKLTLTPHVNPDREIQLDLNPSIESVVEESNADSLRYTPTIAKREVKTTVTIPDRTTVILSGLIREDTARISTKVPWLGDLPLIGFAVPFHQRREAAHEPADLRDAAHRDGHEGGRAGKGPTRTGHQPAGAHRRRWTNPIRTPKRPPGKPRTKRRRGKPRRPPPKRKNANRSRGWAASHERSLPRPSRAGTHRGGVARSGADRNRPVDWVRRNVLIPFRWNGQVAIAGADSAADPRLTRICRCCSGWRPSGCPRRRRKSSGRSTDAISAAPGQAGAAAEQAGQAATDEGTEAPAAARSRRSAGRQRRCAGGALREPDPARGRQARRVGHPHRTLCQCLGGALPHRRIAVRAAQPPAASRERADRAPEGHGAPGPGREAPAAGRRGARPRGFARDRRARVQRARGRRRAHRAAPAAPRIHALYAERTGHVAGDAGSLPRHFARAARHRAGDGSDRQRQDHHALCGPARARHRAPERPDHRGSHRVPACRTSDRCRCIRRSA